MLKELNVKIQINTECDSPNDVKELIRDLLKTCGDKTFSIDSATIDKQEVFKIGKGFVGDLRKKQID